MSWEQRTVVFVVFTAALVAVYDALAWAYGTGESTISVVCMNAAHAYPLLALAAGTVLGHLFAPHDCDYPQSAWLRYLFAHPVLFVLAGLLLGSTFWPLYRDH